MSGGTVAKHRARGQYWLIRVRTRGLLSSVHGEDTFEILEEGHRDEVWLRVARTFGERRIIGMRSIGRSTRLLRRRPSLVDRLTVLEMIRDLVGEGISLTRALSTRLASMPDRMRRMLVPMVTALAAGSTLAAALRMVGFPDDEVRMVEAGEVTGRLEDMMNRVIDFLRHRIQLTQTLRTLAIYPTTVVLVMGGVGWVYRLFVFGNLERVLGEVGTAMPVYSRWLVSLLAWLPLGVLGLGLTVMAWPALRRWIWNQWPLRLIVEPIDVTKTLLVMAASVATGESLDRAFSRSAQVCQTRKMQAAAKAMARWARGEEASYTTMHERMAALGYPSDIAIVLGVGYETGRLEEAIERLVSRYTHKVQETAKRVSLIAEYSLILLLGGLVGGSLVGIYATIFQAITRLG